MCRVSAYLLRGVHREFISSEWQISTPTHASQRLSVSAARTRRRKRRGPESCNRHAIVTLGVGCRVYALSPSGSEPWNSKERGLQSACLRRPALDLRPAWRDFLASAELPTASERQSQMSMNVDARLKEIIYADRSDLRTRFEAWSRKVRPRRGGSGPQSAVTEWPCSFPFPSLSTPSFSFEGVYNPCALAYALDPSPTFTAVSSRPHHL